MGIKIETMAISMIGKYSRMSVKTPMFKHFLPDVQSKLNFKSIFPAVQWYKMSCTFERVRIHEFLTYPINHLRKLKKVSHSSVIFHYAAITFHASNTSIPPSTLDDSCQTSSFEVHFALSHCRVTLHHKCGLFKTKMHLCLHELETAPSWLCMLIRRHHNSNAFTWIVLLRDDRQQQRSHGVCLL